MNIEILISIIIIIGCIILIIIKNSKSEHFNADKRDTDIVLPNPVPPFISNYEEKKEIIINNNDKNNNYPSEKYELKIEAPKVDISPPKPNQPYHDTNFIRDKGVNNAMNAKKLTNEKDYDKVTERYLTFQNPQNSSDLLSTINIRNIPKEELEQNTIADTFNKMTAKVINNISQEQINNITGKPIEDINNTFDLYKPVLSLIDQNLKYNNNDTDIEYKYQPYNELPFGSKI